MTYPQLLTPEEKLAEAKQALNIPHIVVICGSTRFMDDMQEANLQETAAGHIVLAPGVNMKEPHSLWATEEQAEPLKARLDALHRAKIRLAGEVLVVNPGGYIGSSTAREVDYARTLGLPVRWLADHDFWSKVSVTDTQGCWEWQGTRLPTGYGRFKSQGATFYAHRFSYSLRNGPIPPREVVLHSCDNPPCVNPAHLSAGSQAENLRDMRRKGRGANPVLPGESNPNARLTEQQIAEIRGRYASGGVTYRGLAAEYGVHFSQIGYIVRRQSWQGAA